ncbi:MAG: sugar ABC transporter ATP-binding protein [Granulosicoccus sp.]|nr:sugar ABC transporter ATP-binding protein [Granulosicoccus sp.]
MTRPDTRPGSALDHSPASPAHMTLQGVTKRYGGVTALDNVDFACRLGSIHAVLGENGAGKSTLIKIMSGVVSPDEGIITLAGQQRIFQGPAQANAAGVVCIFQELSLIPDLSVADNICISNPPRRFGLIDKGEQIRRAEQLLARIHCEDVNPRSRVRDLPLSRRQMVEIAKALSRDPSVLILDEATSALTSADVDHVLSMLRKLRDEGIAILTISHRMHEIEAVADMCSVFRNGLHIETFAQGDRAARDIVQMMIGREISAHFPQKRTFTPGATALQVQNYHWENRLRDINLTVGKGEIVGLGGLDGQGQKELLLGLFGVLKKTRGTVRINGQAVRITSPQRAIRAGIDMALIPEDRKTEGLLLPMSISDNLALASLQNLSKGIFIDRQALSSAIEGGIARMQIKTGSIEDPVSTLSGGNQQKVVLAKWLMTDPKVVLLNDPTRGIDVGTKQEIYRLLRQLAEEDVSILIYSTDYEELIGCCDRVAVMYDGNIVRELQGEDITEHNIIASSLNIDEAVA